MFRVLILVLTSAISAHSQVLNSSQIHSKVEKIVNDTIAAGAIVTPTGIRAQTNVPVSPDRISELRSLGRPAIGVLSEYSVGPDAKKRRVAIDLLGRVGGPDVVPPLQRVLLHSSHSLNRLIALNWISQSPTNISNPILRQVKDDPDPQIRTRARELLAAQSPESH